MKCDGYPVVIFFSTTQRNSLLSEPAPPVTDWFYKLRHPEAYAQAQTHADSCGSPSAPHLCPRAAELSNSSSYSQLWVQSFRNMCPAWRAAPGPAAASHNHILQEGQRSPRSQWLRAAQTEEPAALTRHKPLESFSVCTEQGCFLMERSQGLRVVAVQRASSLRALESTSERAHIWQHLLSPLLAREGASNQKQQLSRGTQGGQDIRSSAHCPQLNTFTLNFTSPRSSAHCPQFNTFTLNLSLHQPHEARSKIPEAREEKELPAALHGLTARLQPSSLRAPPVPQAHYNCSVPVVFSGYTSSWAQCSCGRRKGIFFPPKPARTGQAVSSLKQPQQQEVKQLSSWKEKMQWTSLDTGICFTGKRGGENLNSAPASSGPVQWLLPAARAHQPKAKRELPLLQLSQVLTPHSRPYYLGRVFPTTKREPPKNQSRDSKRRKSSGLSVRERVLQRGCGYGLHPSVFVGCWEVTGSWALRAAGSNVALKPHLEAFHRGDFGRQGPALGSRWVSSCSHLSSSSLNKNNTGLRMKGRTNRGKYISTGSFACMFPCWKNARIILRAHLQEAGVLSKGRVEGNPACSEHLCAETPGHPRAANPAVDTPPGSPGTLRHRILGTRSPDGSNSGKAARGGDLVILLDGYWAKHRTISGTQIHLSPAAAAEGHQNTLGHLKQYQMTVSGPLNSTSLATLSVFIGCKWSLDTQVA
ncbi:hypothetical protein Anapl_08726 [Anas platyrhynchos]|uniref:Uncharacterized protein n=1 Tax=Anas platyrhynchos TaxID=8839 RepID=R0LD65_ANAPL|nr:hypothetical protein Anapl_08726 [Anas platyrhynchos]